MVDTADTNAGPRAVTSERLRAIASCYGGRLNASSWPAALSARGLVTLPQGDHASWLPTSFELHWTRNPPIDGMNVDAAIVENSQGSETPSAVVRATATVNDLVIAEVTMTAQLRSSPASRSADDLAVPGPRAERTSQTITETEVVQFCDALGTTPWSSERHGWAGVRPRPQMVVPITLLAGHAVELLGDDPKIVSATTHAQSLCGAVHHWIREPNSPDALWVVAANGDPVIEFRTRPLDS